MKLTKTNELPWCPKLRGDTENIWYPACVQNKIDGEYCLLVKDGSWLYTVNKRGLKREEYPALTAINEKLPALWQPRLVCELYYGEGKNNDLYKLLSNKQSDDLNLYVHDFTHAEMTCLERLTMLKKLGLTTFEVVNNDAETLELYNKAVNDGYEGIVIKPCESKLYQTGKWIKMKKTDETVMMVSDLCLGQDRIELKLDHEYTEMTVGAKCDPAMKRTLSTGDLVLVRHFGFLKEGVRNPIVIKKEDTNV